VKAPRELGFNERAAPKAQPIATKAELMARLNARQTPKIERALEPAGHSRNVVKSAHAAENERQIANLRERLLDAKAKLRTGFEKSKDMDRGR
jgi:hypothetical protein